MTNKIQQVCYTVLELEVARLQTVVIFQLQLLITRLLIRKCLFQLKTSLEQFVFDNRQTSRRNQIFFFSSSTIQIYFFKTFSDDFGELAFISPWHFTILQVLYNCQPTIFGNPFSSLQ